jgi:hypothetical protein
MENSRLDSCTHRAQVLVNLFKRFLFQQKIVGAEIGVRDGETSEIILVHYPLLERLIAVDPFTEHDNLGPVPQEFCDLTLTHFLTRVKNVRKRIDLITLPSTTAAQIVSDNSLDFIFIDTNHSYENVLSDIRAWTPKVKKGGLITGHDYNEPHCPGVAQAVNEVFSLVNTAPDWVWWLIKGEENG